MAESRRVSDDAAKILDDISGLSAERLASEGDKAEGMARDMGYSPGRCVWFGGCYYCNDSGGWYLVYCIA